MDTKNTAQTIYEAQRQFYQSGKTRDVNFRLQQLKKLERLLAANVDELHAAIYADFKKSRFDNYANELSFVFQEVNLAIKKVRKWSRRKRVKTNWVNWPAKSYLLPEPLGTVLVIAPWNYPYQLSFTPLISALAAGNTVILKPSELAPNTSAVMCRLINENFDAAYLHVVEGGAAVVTDLLKNPFNKIFFTGSTRVGQIVYEAAAKHLTPVILELGGKNPAFVTANCNLKMTVKRLVWGKYLNAGQSCVAPDYVLVDQKIKPAFMQLLKAEIEQAAYKTEHHNYVQIINDKNWERLVALIEPEKVVYGGQSDRAERLIEPTVLDGVTVDDPVMEGEIFGPIMPVLTYQTLEKAIELARHYPKPLSCYVYSKQRSEVRQVMESLSYGNGGVNESVMQITNKYLPFGGVGMSGIGNYHGKYSFDAFSHYKSVLDKPTWFELPLKYHPLTDKKLKIVKRFLGLGKY